MRRWPSMACDVVDAAIVQAGFVTNGVNAVATRMVIRQYFRNRAQADAGRFDERTGRFRGREQAGVIMGAKFWSVRLLKVFLGVFLVLMLVEILKGHGVGNAVYFALLWAFVSTLVFALVRLYYLRRGQHCELCGDTPESQGADRSPPRSD